MRANGVEFAAWYEAERDGLARSLYLVAGDAEAARDAVAEAFSRAYERWPRVGAMASPTGWVFRVALNELRRRMRRRDLELRLLCRDPAPTMAPMEVDPELWTAVASLALRQREVVVLRYVSDMTEREIGQVLGISEGAVSALLVAARRRLAHELRDHHQEASTP